MIISSGKGQYFNIWDKVSIEKLQNEHHAVHGHEESIKNMFFCVELCLLFSAGQLINRDSMRIRCYAGGGTGTWVVHPILSPGHVIEINDH